MVSFIITIIKLSLIFSLTKNKKDIKTKTYKKKIKMFEIFCSCFEGLCICFHYAGCCEETDEEKAQYKECETSQNDS